MKGGQDKGFCFNYWQMSYRRKFLRNLWMIFVGSIALPPIGIVFPDAARWVLMMLEFSSVVGAITLVYTYRRWQAEMRAAENNIPTT